MISEQTAALGAAGAKVEDSGLTVTTGVVERKWRLIPAGLQTISYRRVPHGGEWIADAPDSGADWHIFALMSPRSRAETIDAVARSVEDDPLCLPYVETTWSFRYDEYLLEIRYEIRAWPGAPGLWVRIAMRMAESVPARELPCYLGGSWGESFRTNVASCDRLAAGYYNDTQHRNRDETPLLKEQRTGGSIEGFEVYDWANLLRLTRDGEGMTLVKESHKCVNQAGVDTGEFVLEPGCLRVTGVGLTNVRYSGYDWASPGDWRTTWATWSILHDPDADRAELALKQFDRTRYPFDPERDLYVMSNTWGSGGAGENSRKAAEEQNVIRELRSGADLGVDLVQIDDGWQLPPDPDTPLNTDWRPQPPRWPNGWSTVRQVADELGMDLGLWAAASADLDSLKKNWDEARFRCFKIDWMRAEDRDGVDFLVNLAQELIAYTDYTSRVNWDVTENPARLGYYFAREFGCLYLENRENGPGELKRLCHVRYTPRLVLRDAWHVARYMNLNQVQITFQNKDLTVPDLTNCREYSHAYNLAITLMGLPIFFQLTQLLSPEARAEIKPIMARYRKHRQAMQAGYVFPIGDEPCDRAWTGFLSHDESAGRGYILVFRELYNDQVTGRIRLPFLGGRTLATLDLMSGASDEWAVGDDGMAEFSLAEPGTFLWAKYELR